MEVEKDCYINDYFRVPVGREDPGSTSTVAGTDDARCVFAKGDVDRWKHRSCEDWPHLAEELHSPSYSAALLYQTVISCKSF